MNISSRVEHFARSSPQRPCVIFGERVICYEQMDAYADAAADRLGAAGVSRGDRVVLLLSNRPEFPAVYLGALKLGAVAVALNPSLTLPELRVILADCSPKVAVVSGIGEGLAALAAELGFGLMDCDCEIAACLAEGRREGAGRRAAPMREDDIAVIAYTSGTSGVAKGVMLSHGNVSSNAEAKRTHLGITPQDRLLLFLPLFHCFGQNAIMNAGFHSGAAVVLHQGLDRGRIVRSVERDAVTMFFAVPVTYRMLLDAPRDGFRSVRLFFSAASALPQEVQTAWRERFGRPILQGYGLTETSPFAAFSRGERPGSIGAPIAGVSMKVVSPETGDELSAGAVGELMVKGPNVMLGYWRRDAETRAALSAGWLRTGDLGWRDKEGYFYFADRLKDMINVAGQKVYPAEVEAVIALHPQVADAAVFGVADPVIGEIVVASVVWREGGAWDARELVDTCRRHLARFKWPARFNRVAALPRSPSGKVLKRLMRDEALAHMQAERPEGGRGAPQSACDIEAWLCDWLQGRDRPSPSAAAVDPSRSFADQAFSSVQLVLMTRELGGLMGLELPPSLPWTCPTPQDFATRVEELANARGAAAASFPAPDDGQLVMRPPMMDLLRSGSSG